MPSFADSIFLFVLALLLFGPKRLPVLARELGKWIGEFRRASNEFKMQMDEELRASEQADRQKQIAAMEAAAPLPPPLEEPEHPHRPRATEASPLEVIPPVEAPSGEVVAPEAMASDPVSHLVPEPINAERESADGVRPIPIAVSGDLRMMPPATGLPTPRARNGNGHGNALGGLLDSIPEASPAVAEPAFTDTHTESPAHGD
ncbi:MAG: twin-arginine translocase TatA/TatE family subunit [Janthinobacterium lividum]